ncbi:hypothetical protein J6590_030240 [Homalodisca vitripennis]|nr:hypothetical protein J6590_030240 [Homalodisca vitripennis]
MDLQPSSVCKARICQCQSEGSPRKKMRQAVPRRARRVPRKRAEPAEEPRSSTPPPPPPPRLHQMHFRNLRLHDLLGPTRLCPEDVVPADPGPGERGALASLLTYDFTQFEGIRLIRSTSFLLHLKCRLRSPISDTVFECCERT